MASILLHPRLEKAAVGENVSSSEFTCYFACVNQYVFLIDNYSFFKSHENYFLAGENATLIL